MTDTPTDLAVAREVRKKRQVDGSSGGPPVPVGVLPPKTIRGVS